MLDYIGGVNGETIYGNLNDTKCMMKRMNLAKSRQITKSGQKLKEEYVQNRSYLID